MKIHDEIEDWMAGALCQALTPDEQKNFEQHLAQCPHCRSLYEENQKMNDILNQTFPELRPDQNFERRVIAAFREKIAGGGFHPLRGLAWIMRFRTVQAALALLLLAAMVKGGSMISGERFAGGKTYTAQDYARMQTHTRALADSALNSVIGQIHLASAGRDGITVTGGTGTRQYSDATMMGNVTIENNPGSRGTLAFNGGTSDTRTLSGTLSDNGNNVNITSLSPKGPAVGYNAQVFSGKASWTGQTGGLEDLSAAGVNKTVALGGNQTWTVARGGTEPLTVNGNVSGGHALSVTGSGNITFGGGNLQYSAGNNHNTVLGANTTINSLSFPVAAKDIHAIDVDVNGQTVTSGRSIAKADPDSVSPPLRPLFNDPTPKSSLVNRSTLGASSDVTSTLNVTGTQSLTGINTYTGATTLNSGALVLSGTVSNSTGGTAFTGTIASTGTSLGAYNYTRVPLADGKKGETKRGGSAVNGYNLAANEPHPGAAKPGEQTPSAMQPAPAPVDSRKLIRNAALDFEVLSFEKALDTITGVAGEEQGYVFSQNSAKGPNGKLQGQVIVKVLPQNLDRLLLKLRLLGDMKNQTVSAQDVSKDYYDTEARIRNSQVTEARLIDMMKTRTGKVSDLLEVENEISRVRGEIEQMQGQLQVYDAQVQYATVTITLQEKDINQTAAYLLQEHAQLSLFSKDVEKAFADAKSAAAEAKSQTIESHIERDGAGHVVATLHLLIPPDASDEAIGKLKAIGRIDHFDAQTQRVARDGNAYSDTAKVDRDKVELNLVIQQDAENAVQGTNISVLTDKVEEKTAQIKETAAAVGVEVKGAEFNRAQNGVEVSSMLLRMPVKKYAAFLEQIKSLGKVKDFTVARREDATATDDAPAEIALQIYSQGSIVAPDTGLWVTVRGTLGEGMAALMWSVRMIGVSLAFVAPWAVGLGLMAWLVARRRRVARKQG